MTFASFLRLILLGWLALGLVPVVHAAKGPAVKAGPVTAQLVSPHNSVNPGESFVVGLRLTMDRGWHTYSQEPGVAGLPTTIEWDLPAGVEAGEIAWPPDREFLTGDLVTRGYSGEVILPVRLTMDPALPADGEITLRATTTWLACDIDCIPGGADLELTLPLTRGTPAPDEGVMALLAAQSGGGSGKTGFGWSGLLLAAGAAFLGGLILNLMPCVLPVLSLKIFGFVQQAGQDPRRARWHGLSFAAGVVGSFLALATVLLVLRAGGQALGWGFQLQSPFMVALLAFVFVLLALNLLGVFEIGMGLTRLGGKTGNLTGHGRSFADGILAAVVASPCTAPFMGAALGFSLSQPPAGALSIFAALGLGLATPYLVLAFWPRLLRWIPKPGPWMETFKQLLAFPLLATVVWLLWVFGLQTGVAAMAWLAGGLLVAGLAAWIYGTWGTPARSPRVRRTAQGFAAILLAAAVLGSSPQSVAMEAGGAGVAISAGWEEFSPERLAELRESNQPVFIDFTAAWCITCQWNKRSVLDTARVQQAFQQNNVTLLQADWTRQDDTIARILQEYGRQSVPLYLYFNGKDEPVVLPELLTADIVLRALES
jgi:thiol:disulfide interchange protein